jgi:hypothetical protein
MARPRQSALTRLARTLRRQPPRPGLQGAVQRAAIALLPRPAPALPARVETRSPDGEIETSRLRARRALLEARQALSGMLGETPGGTPAGVEALGEAPPPDLERLRAHLEESQRDQVALRQEIGRLRREMEELARRLARLEATTPAPAADEPDPSGGIEAKDASGGPPAVLAPADEGPPPAPVAADGAGPDTERAAQDEDERGDDATAVRELRERVLRALRDRVFAAGTVGTRIELAPAPDAGELQAIVERLQGQPLVDSAEPIEMTEVAASIRVTLRAPLRWEQFGGLLERALQRPLRPGEVHWSHGAVRVRSAGDRAATPPMPDVAVGAAPDDAV